MRDFIREKGTTAFGTRLRRLSERMDRDVREIYRARGIDFEPSWFPVFLALSEIGPLSVGELAQHMGITHAAVSQIRGKLKGAKLIAVTPDVVDQRRQMLQLSTQGHALIKKLKPLWAAIAQATTEICQDEAPQLLKQLDALDAALDRRSLVARVDDTMNRRGRTPSRAKGEKSDVAS